MRTMLRKGRVVFANSKHGISIVRDFLTGRTIRLGKYAQGRRRIGSIVSFMGTVVRKKRGRENLTEVHHPFPKDERLPSVKKPVLPVELPANPEEPIPECPLDGLILASQQGYWLIIVDPLYSPNSNITWLGNNPAHECIIKVIGSVTKFPDSGYISGLPARWAFQDRVRKFTMPTRYSSDNLFPYRTSTVNKNESYSGVDSVAFAHYGYSMDMEPYRNGVRSMAFPGGAYGARSYKWFSRNYLCMADSGEDFGVYNTIGWDAFKSVSGYIGTAGISYGRVRIRGLEPAEDCITKVVRSGSIRQRVLDSINNARMCEFNVSPVIDGNSDQAVAYDYATEMAAYEHFSHTGYFGSTLEERAEDGGLSWTIIGEVLALVDDPGLPDPDDNLDAVADQIVEAWETSPVHWDALMSSAYFRFSCAAIKSSSNKWYACGILRSISTDEYVYRDSMVVTAIPPPMAGGVYEGDGWDEQWLPYAQYVSLRGFCTIPTEDPSVVHVTRRIWWGYIVPFSIEVNVQDNFEYPSDSGALEGGITIPQNTIAYEDALEEYPLHYYNGSKIRSDEIVNFYYQYTGALQKDIFVKLYPMTESGNADSPDEVVNTPITANRTDNAGRCTLFMGACEIDDSYRDRFHGLHCNPYQTISVAGVFHSNSGYTVIVYTMPETLNNDYIHWDYTYVKNGLTYDGEMYQRYYKTKQSLWCAVVSGGVLLARWELEGQQEEEHELSFWPEEDRFTQIDPPQQDFIVNFNGIIEQSSVYVECVVNDVVVVFTDAGDGTLTEQEYQIEGQQYILASSSIDYDTGTVNYTFGTLKPDIDTVVLTKAQVSAFKETLLPFEATTEIICESFWPGYSPPITVSYSYFPVSFNTKGVFPGAISATITEDGRYVIVSLSVYEALSGMLITRLTSGGYDSNRYANTMTLRHNGDPPQVLVYDLTQKDEETELIPKLVNLPFYLIKEKLTETVVLN